METQRITFYFHQYLIDTLGYPTSVDVDVPVDQLAKSDWYAHKAAHAQGLINHFCEAEGK